MGLFAHSVPSSTSPKDLFHSVVPMKLAARVVCKQHAGRQRRIKKKHEKRVAIQEISISPASARKNIDGEHVPYVDQEAAATSARSIYAYYVQAELVGSNFIANSFKKTM